MLVLSFFQPSKFVTRTTSESDLDLSPPRKAGAVPTEARTN
jgi:hypothetical protein